MRRFLIPLAFIGSSLSGQGLPSHQPLNPGSASRSGLFAEPYEAAAPRSWRISTGLEYGNAIDADSTSRGTYLLDAELLRLSVRVRRDIGSQAFAAAEVTGTGAYAGFADGFFTWYHRLIHFDQPERTARPRNQFAYHIRTPDGIDHVRQPYSLAFGDLRGMLGIRMGPSLQSVVSLTLPTATGPAGYGRGTVSAAAMQTVHLEAGSRLVYESGFGLGFTPRHGDLAAYQRTWFASVSTGVSVRLWGSQSVYGSFFYHSPYYRGTTLLSLDRRELTADFGWLSRGRDGRGWHIGFTEDLAPGDPGIDLILSVGRTW